MANAITDAAVETDEKSITPPDPETIRKEFEASWEYWEAQLRDEIGDLEFQVPERQWPDDIRQARLGNQSGGAPSPPRPCLTVPQLGQPVDLVKNRMQQAHLGVQITPVSEEATDDTAEVMQDIYRAIERDSNAPNPRNWAFTRAIKAGRGWYKIDCVWDDASPSPFDQKIIIARVLYQENVFVDPTTNQIDMSDMRYLFEVAWVPLADFKKDYPKSEAAKGDFSGAASFDKSLWGDVTKPQWVDIDGSRGIMVAAYWTRDKSTEKVAMWEDAQGNQQIGKFSEVPKSATVIRSRDVDVWKVCRHVVAPGGKGLEVVESTEWDGQYIPYVPVFGDEMIPFDGRRRFKGIIRDAKDPVRMTNYFASTATEVVAIERPQGPLVMEGQIEGYEKVWSTLATVSHAYVPFKPVDLDGKPTDFVPRRMETDTSKLQNAMMLLEQSKSWVQGATQTPEASLGQVDQHRSGKAIERLQQQSAMSQDGYLQNFSNISMPCEAMIVIDLMPKKYDRPGRVMRVTGHDEQPRTIMLNAPFRMPEGSSMPQRVDLPKDGTMELPSGVKHYDLSKGTYAEAVSVGTSWGTRKQEGASELADLMKSFPESFLMIAPDYFQFSDIPGGKNLAEMFRKLRDQKWPFLNQSEDGQKGVEQLQAENQALQGQMQQGMAAFKQLQQEQATDAVKNQAMLQKAQIDAQSRETVATQNNEAKIMVAGIAAKVQESTAKMEAMISLLLDRSQAAQAAFDRRHVKDLAESGAVHEMGLAAATAGHEQRQADAAHQKAQEMSSLGHDQALEQQQIAAEQAPDKGETE